MISLDDLFKIGLDVGCLGDIDTALGQAVSACGIHYYCYAGYGSACHDQIDFEVTNFPSAWREIYHRCGWFSADPLIRAVRRSVAPVDWSSFFESHTCGDDEISLSRAREVSRLGVSFHIGVCNGLRGILSIARPDDSESWSRRRLEYTRDFLVISTTIHQSYARIFADDENQPASLSPRQRQCLVLAAEGMTTKKIAFTLCISERAAREYIENAMKKLNCSNRSHAISRATQLNLI